MIWTESNFQCFCFVQGSLCLHGSVVLPWRGHVARQAQWEYTKAEGDWRLRWQVSFEKKRKKELCENFPNCQNASLFWNPACSVHPPSCHLDRFWTGSLVISVVPSSLFLHQPNGRAALLHGEVERSDEKVPPHSSALPRAVPGAVWRLGSQRHHPGSRAR